MLYQLCLALRSGACENVSGSSRRTEWVPAVQEEKAHAKAAELENQRIGNVQNHRALKADMEAAFSRKLDEVAKPQRFTGI